MPNHYRFSILLSRITLLLLLASLGAEYMKYALGHGHLLGMEHLFNVNAEQNLPTFFSVLLLLTASSLLAYVARQKLAAADPYTRQWTILSLGFLLMAADEMMSLHELLTVSMRALVPHGHGYGLLYFSWIVPAMAMVGLIGLMYIRFLKHLPRVSRLYFIRAACIYLGGAIGMEMLGGRYAEMAGADNFTYNLFTTVEEGLEMLGVIYFIDALLGYIDSAYGHIAVNLQAVPSIDEQPQADGTQVAT